MTDLDALAERLRALPGVLAKADIGLVADVLGGGDWYAGPGRRRGGAARRRRVGRRRRRGDPAGVRGRRSLRRGHRRGADQRQRPGRHGCAAGGPARHRGRSARTSSREVLRGHAVGRRALRRPDRRRPPDPHRRPAGAVGVRHRPRRAGAVGHRGGAPGRCWCSAAASTARCARTSRSSRRSSSGATGWPATSGCSPTWPPSGAAVAAKDVSMAGLVGSLAMLLEHGPARRDRRPRRRCPCPTASPLADWLGCFPAYAFLLTTARRSAWPTAWPAFAGRGLTAAAIGELDDTGEVRLARAGRAR